MSAVPRVLTIASSDSGGGAGIQADLKAFARCGAHGMSAIVALTAQNTLGVTAIHELPPEFVRAQIDAVLDDIGADAAKTGMLFSAPLIDAVADALAPRNLPLVVDPVMVASSGAKLLLPEAVGTLTKRLFPLATVVTPNLPEAQALTEMATEDRAALAERLVALGAPAALVTGGHGSEPVDHLFDGSRHLAIPVKRRHVAATHGAGCTHSAALAAGLAAGLSLAEAAEQAAVVADDAVAHGLAGLGGGDGPVHALHDLAPRASLSGEVITKPCGLLGRHAEQGLAVELITGQDGQPTAQPPAALARHLVPHGPVARRDARHGQQQPPGPPRQARIVRCDHHLRAPLGLSRPWRAEPITSRCCRPRTRPPGAPGRPPAGRRGPGPPLARPPRPPVGADRSARPRCRPPRPR
jgi:hydroxymethylpyrimidine/phosphomethylpyrimidine kinase